MDICIFVSVQFKIVIIVLEKQFLGACLKMKFFINLFSMDYQYESNMIKLWRKILSVKQ